MSSVQPRILIVCEHASNRFGGEAMLPLNYFVLLSQRLPQVHLITHIRTRNSIEAIPGIDTERIHYIPDTWLHVQLNKLSGFLPDRVALASTGALMHLITQIYQWRIARRVIRQHNINVIHEPAPVSPRQPSILFGLGVSIIIGPMNGGMDFPPAFRHMTGRVEKALYRVMRGLTDLYNLCLPGKFFADILLVANARTRQALPALHRGKVIELVENGVFAHKIIQHPRQYQQQNRPVALYVGRLQDWKAIDILIDALRECQNANICLRIVGDGPERINLQNRATDLTDRVEFVGAIPHDRIMNEYDQADMFLLPSIRECGGAVVLEAMARGLPVVATNWGGPADYITTETGLLIDPLSREHLVTEFARAMDNLVANPSLREQYGTAAVARIRQEFTWEDKIDRMLKIYAQAMTTHFSEADT